MSDFSALNTAITGLHAHKQRIDVIGDNIANVETPGYHRQVAELRAIDTRRPGLHSGPGGQHGGVEASVNRRWDQLLDTNAKNERGRAASFENQAAALANLETEIGSLTPGGLADRLEQLWNGFDDLANDPSDLGVRSVAIGNGEAVVAALNDDAKRIDDSRTTSVDQAEIIVRQANDLAARIAELDQTVAAGTAEGNPPSSVLDQRDALASELVGLIGAQVSYQANGQVRISVDGHNLVSEGMSRQVELAANDDTALLPLGYQRLSLAADSGRALKMSAGGLHGTLLVANDLIPAQRVALDKVAETLVRTVNDLHRAGAGLDGSTGSNFFSPAGVTADTIAMSADVVGNPQKVAASDGSAALNNSTALALAGLGVSATGASTVHAEVLTELGNVVRTLVGRADTAQYAADHAESVRQSAVGVNLDEELADLVSAQRAYEASSRMISAIDEMLDVLINRTGLVGR